MRYTTVIDISESAAVYRNINARLVYLHLCLKAGYHDHDRDLVNVSIRNLANNVGLTVSATRHALHVLETAHLVARQGPLLYVRKWLPEQPITSRAKTQRQQRQIDIAAERRREQERREQEQAVEARRREMLEAEGKTTFMAYYESKILEAQQGDAEAARIVEKHRATYEAHKRNMQLNKRKG